MNTPASISKPAWLPLTPQGVAAFASATSGRLLLVQFAFAVVAAATVGWFLSRAWTPTIRDAIRALPDESRIQQGKLEWPGPSPALLAEGRFIGFAVDLDHRGEATASSDIVIELGATDWQVTSLLGMLDLPGLLDTTYPGAYTIGLNQKELGPWWGAREPFLIALAMGATGLLLMVSWTLLATLYAPFVRLAAFYANREVTLSGCWRLAGAALMPGALFMTAALVFYGLEAFDLMRLALAFGMHFIVGWFYLFVATACLPRIPDIPPAGTNPFTAGPAGPPG